jgi:hypothetical protein
MAKGVVTRADALGALGVLAEATMPRFANT